jgi:hypothetical protein
MNQDDAPVYQGFKLEENVSEGLLSFLFVEWSVIMPDQPSSLSRFTVRFFAG